MPKKPSSAPTLPKKVNWEDLRKAPKQPKGPPKPWTKDMQGAADEFVAFMKDSKSKKELQQFLMEAYRKFEAEKAEQFRAKILQEKADKESKKLAPGHEPSNITPMLAEAFNMADSEHAFTRALKGTKAAMVKTIEDRAEEISRLLSGLGGFSSQLKSCFARSTVVFLEQEDPKLSFRERLIFSINLPNYELKRCWAKKLSAEEKAQGKAKRAIDEDPRTKLQATWDDAVNALSQIIASTGLKPKYVKNDRHYGRYVMKQDLRSSANLPDEYFSFTLDYNTAERIREMIGPYNEIVRKYEKKINKLTKQVNSWPQSSTSPRYLALKKRQLELCQERDFFVGTTPDPNQLDEGLLFMIEVSTLKDYHIVKDRMQSIMTKYILHLSKIAVKDAEVDPDLGYELWKSKQAAGANKPQPQPAEAPHDPSALSVEDLESLPQYVIRDGGLQPYNPEAQAREQDREEGSEGENVQPIAKARRSTGKKAA